MYVFSFEYGRIFKNTYLEEGTSVNSCFYINLSHSIKRIFYTNFSKFYTSKIYSFSLQLSWKYSSSECLLEYLWIEKLTHNLVSWASCINEALRMGLNTSVFSYGKGLIEKFNYAKSIPVMSWSNLFLCYRPLKEIRVIRAKNQVGSFPHKTFY